MIIELVAGTFLLYIVNKHQCNVLTICSFFNNLFTLIGNNGLMQCRVKIGLVTEVFILNYRSLFFKLTDSEEFGETSIATIETPPWSCRTEIITLNPILFKMLYNTYCIFFCEQIPRTNPSHLA